MRNKLFAAALIGAAMASTSAMAGKVNPEIILGSGTTGSIVSTQALVNAIQGAIGGNLQGFLARLAGVPGVSFGSDGGASFALNVDGKVYDVKVKSDGSVEATPRA